jgi:hypothetical protein
MMRFRDGVVGLSSSTGYNNLNFDGTVLNGIPFSGVSASGDTVYYYAYLPAPTIGAQPLQWEIAARIAPEQPASPMPACTIVTFDP